MGGIIGKLGFDRREPLAAAVSDAMLDALRQARGAPREMHTAPGIALGSRGWPVAACGNIRAVAASSITNGGPLRVELQRLGHAWRDDGDSELVARAYAEWGPSCVKRLRGAFACAIWDDDAGRLLLARDHFGIHPLYFALLPDRGVAFASEIRALLADPGVDRRWCAAAIDAYLALGYVPAPMTPYERISKLEPAQLVIVEGHSLRVEQYWDPAAPSSSSAALDVAAALDRRLRTVVRGELESGTPTTLLYSGGAASTVLLGASPRGGARAITVAVDEDPTELARSQAVAARLGCARELETPATPLPVIASRLAAALEEPIADPAAVTQFAVFAAARARTESALAGHGAALLWTGAAHHRQALWDGFHRREIYTRGFAWEVREANPLARHLELYASREGSAHDRALYVDIRTFLPDSTLASAHGGAAAAGIRLRVPFLDYELVQLASTTTGALSGRRRGPVLKQLLLQNLPRPLIPTGKAAPAAPHWLRDAIESLVPALLLTPRFDGRGIVSRPALAELWNEYRAGRASHATRLWSLVVLECWFREFIDGGAAEEPLEYAVVKVA